jgi:energy-coupling factor transporter ATP-binding protein EcfA2
VLDIITDLNVQGKTIVLVTHDDKVAARAHRIVHMKDGVIDREVINRPAPTSGNAGPELESRTPQPSNPEAQNLIKPGTLLASLMLTSKFISTVKLGVKSLMLHKLRSALTMLGIIFGVCSVIAMLAIGEGASYEAQEAIKKLGSNNIILRSVKPAEESRQSSAGGRSFMLDYGLTYKDGARLQSTIPGVKRVLPMRIIRENVRFSQNEFPAR